MSTRPKRTAAVAALQRLHNLNKGVYETEEVTQQPRKRRVHAAAETDNGTESQETQTVVKRQKRKTRRKIIREQEADDVDHAMASDISGLPKPELSVEVWALILEQLPPSQLAVFAQVSRPLAAIVEYLPVWRNIAEKAKLGEPKLRGKCKTYYALVIKNSKRICERCYALCDNSGSGSALPVYIEEYGQDINMCIQCRRHHFTLFPEPYKEDLTTGEEGQERPLRITKGDAAARFRLSEFDLDSLPYLAARNPYYRSAAPMRLYCLRVVIDCAREVHGGDVGIVAAKAKLHQIRQHRAERERQRREQRQREQAARREQLNIRMEAENITDRLARRECEAFVSMGGDLEQLIRTIQAREHRRTELEAALANVGLSYRDDYDLIDYVNYGLKTLEQAVATEQAKERRRIEQQQRREELTARLNARGLQLRSDSVLCTGYIATGSGNIDQIVTIMVEMDWYFRVTTYATRYGYSEQKKQAAQKDFLESRLRHGNFATSFENDDENVRPPASLWAPLKQKMPEIWKSYASRMTYRQIDKNETLRNTLVEAFRNGINSVNDEIISMAIDAAVQLSLQESNIQYNERFTEALRQVLGQVGFNAYIAERKQKFGNHVMNPNTGRNRNHFY